MAPLLRPSRLPRVVAWAGPSLRSRPSMRSQPGWLAAFEALGAGTIALRSMRPP